MNIKSIRNLVHSLILESMPLSLSQITNATKYWGLNADLYEKLFEKITSVDELKSVYNGILHSDAPKQRKEAATFFYRLRRDELRGDFSWDNIKKENRIKKSDLIKLIKEEIKNLKEATFDSELFWSEWKNKHGSITAYAKKRHELIQYIMDMPGNKYTQEQLEKYSNKDLQNLK